MLEDVVYVPVCSCSVKFVFPDKEKELRSLEIKMSRTESPGTTKRKIKRSKWLESSSEDSNEELSLSAKKVKLLSHYTF